MMNHRDDSDNSRSDRDRPPAPEEPDSLSDAGDSTTGEYYYDDSTGYEVYDDDDDDEDEDEDE
jgi:hypothetical protein